MKMLSDCELPEAVMDFFKQHAIVDVIGAYEAITRLREEQILLPEALASELDSVLVTLAQHLQREGEQATSFTAFAPPPMGVLLSEKKQSLNNVETNEEEADHE